MTTVLISELLMSASSSVVQLRNLNLLAACRAWAPVAAQTEIREISGTAFIAGIRIEDANPPAPSNPTLIACTRLRVEETGCVPRERLLDSSALPEYWITTPRNGSRVLPVIRS